MKPLYLISAKVTLKKTQQTRTWKIQYLNFKRFTVKISVRTISKKHKHWDNTALPNTNLIALKLLIFREVNHHIIFMKIMFTWILAPSTYLQLTFSAYTYPSLFCITQTCNFIKKRLQYRCFPVKLAKYLRTPILKNIYERLLLVLLLSN